MCKTMEEMQNEAIWNRIIENVLRWLKLGIDKAMIAEGEGITIEQVDEIERANKGITACSKYIFTHNSSI